MVLEWARAWLRRLIRAIRAWADAILVRLDAQRNLGPRRRPAASEGWLESAFLESYPEAPAHWIADLRKRSASLAGEPSPERRLQWVHWKNGTVSRAAPTGPRPGSFPDRLRQAAAAGKAAAATAGKVRGPAAARLDIRKGEPIGAGSAQPARSGPTEGSAITQPSSRPKVLERRVAVSAESRGSRPVHPPPGIGSLPGPRPSEAEPRTPDAFSDSGPQAVPSAVEGPAGSGRDAPIPAGSPGTGPLRIGRSPAAPSAGSWPELGDSGRSPGVPVPVRTVSGAGFPGLPTTPSRTPGEGADPWPPLLEPEDGWFVELDTSGPERDRGRVLDLEQEGRRWNG